MLDLFPKEQISGTKLSFIAFDSKGIRYALPLLKQVREAGISAEIYPEAAKMKKQMNYANSNAIPYVAIVGDTEMQANKVMLKDMNSGTQALVSLQELMEKVK